MDAKLRAYATERELKYIDAIEECGSARKAAIKLEVSSTAIDRAILRLKSRAAKRNYSPDHDMNNPTADGFSVTGLTTLYDADGKVKMQYVKVNADKDRIENQLRDLAEELSQQVHGLAKPISPPEKTNSNLLCVIPMGDPHFGMHAWWQDAGDDFDLKAAERLTCAAIERLISASPKASTGLLLNLGDMFHADNQKNQTQSGHQLDVDGRWSKVQQVGLRSQIYCINKMLEVYDKVVYKINAGNHDAHSSYALALMLSCYFHNEPRVEVDLSAAKTWYYRHGKTLIGSTHGDTIKGASLPGIMATDKPEWWGMTTKRYWYVGHVHHKDVKEYPGAIVEYFRTLAARDAWHQGQGYRAGRDMCLLVLDSEFGEIERHQCDVGMIDIKVQ